MLLPPLISGRLIARRKRFLADVSLDHGPQVTAHCPNTGSMLGACTPGSRVWLSHDPKPTRRYAHTWELIAVGDELTGVNTQRSNSLVVEALQAGRIPALAGFTALRREVPYGREGSRIDLVLEGLPLPSGQPGLAYVEVKNCTLVEERVARFPDSVSERAQKHCRELATMVRQGHRAAIVFCVQRGDVDCWRPADDLDPAYGKELRKAVRAGVELYAMRAVVTTEAIALTALVPVVVAQLATLRPGDAGGAAAAVATQRPAATGKPGRGARRAQHSRC